MHQSIWSVKFVGDKYFWNILYQQDNLTQGTVSFRIAE